MRTILLASLAYFVQVTAAIAIIEFFTLGFKSPAIAMARINPGNAIIISPSLIITVSTIPPKYPASTPSIVPTEKIMNIKVKVMNIEYLEPYITLENKSLPS